MGIPPDSLVHSGNIKDILIPRFLKDELIQKLVMPRTDETLSLEENWSAHCLDTPFHPGTVPEHQAICLCLDTEVAYVRKSTLEHKLTISAYASLENIRLTNAEKEFYKSSYGLAGTRIDMVIAAVHRNLSKDMDFSRSLGIGQINLTEDKDPVTSHWRDNGWYGKSIVYSIYR